ncbi:hypothetical protein [Terribacillus sp. DMT04]|nr:hypothetical protein [Terribacillus sp. DMT04]
MTLLQKYISSLYPFRKGDPGGATILYLAAASHLELSHFYYS